MKKFSYTISGTALIVETITYYNENGSEWYLLMLDASKAFDRLDYVNICFKNNYEYVC